jgi:hypothetical protein
MHVSRSSMEMAVCKWWGCWLDILIHWFHSSIVDEQRKIATIMGLILTIGKQDDFLLKIFWNLGRTCHTASFLSKRQLWQLNSVPQRQLWRNGDTAGWRRWQRQTAIVLFHRIWCTVFHPQAGGGFSLQASIHWSTALTGWSFEQIITFSYWLPYAFSSLFGW